MQTIEINVPYAKRHLVTEIKANGGKFSPENKTWSLQDSPENRALKALVERRIAGPSPAQRVNNIATLAVDLLNALKLRQFTLAECGDRVVIESTPVVAASTPPVAAGVVADVKSTPVIDVSETLVTS